MCVCSVCHTPPSSASQMTVVPYCWRSSPTKASHHASSWNCPAVSWPGRCTAPWPRTTTSTSVILSAETLCCRAAEICAERWRRSSTKTPKWVCLIIVVHVDMFFTYLLAKAVRRCYKIWHVPLQRMLASELWLRCQRHGLHPAWNILRDKWVLSCDIQLAKLTLDVTLKNLSVLYIVTLFHVGDNLG